MPYVTTASGEQVYKRSSEMPTRNKTHRDIQKRWSAARNATLRRLREMHAEEYEAILAEEKRSQGLGLG